MRNKSQARNHKYQPNNQPPPPIYEIRYTKYDIRSTTPPRHREASPWRSTPIKSESTRSHQDCRSRSHSFAMTYTTASSIQHPASSIPRPVSQHPAPCLLVRRLGIGNSEACIFRHSDQCGGIFSYWSSDPAKRSLHFSRDDSAY